MANQEKLFSVAKQDILTGSSRLKTIGSNKDRVQIMFENMDKNKAYLSALENSPENPDELLKKFQNAFRVYRENWNSQPENCIEKQLLSKEMREQNIIPLSLDVETAAICDLACPFCFREHVATPDKAMNFDVFKKLIDQAAVLSIPSVKLNWRGEPLLQPKLPEYIAYAKQKGILETIINTNATNLDEKKSNALIDAGLDFMIYSFDGGTKETYEKMRPGRFRKNSFDEVYGNIMRFAEIKQKKGAVFPYTKIQMILTEDTRPEQENFFKLFSECVDEVTLTQYSERGGGLNDLKENDRERLEEALDTRGLSKSTPYMLDSEGNLFIASERESCKQPYQRLMVTYDGRVGMCCHDWGATHTIGYVDERAIREEFSENIKVLEKANKKSKGYELLNLIKIPAVHNEPEKRVTTLSDIWYGEEVDKVRQVQIDKALNELPVCAKCSFKDTYSWKLIEHG